MRSLFKRLARSLGYEVRAIQEPPLGPLPGEPKALDYELLRTFATRAARLSVPAAETRALRQLYLTGILGAAPSLDEARIARGGPHTLKLGVWKREGAGKDAAFVRTADSRAEWFFWAARERIEPKTARWRVVLLGESVARGYLYDPQFNPASALASVLESELGAGQVDVVDLAKSNLGIGQLKETMGQCLALQPDLIVVFAGNNWRPQLTEADIPCADTLLRTQGVPALRAFLDERTREAVKLLRRQVNDLLDRHGKLPVVWVVPEFNLADWADPISNAPHLPGRGNARWRELDERAALALRAKDFGLAESLAAEMADLDGGTSSVPLRILAECRRSAQDPQEARRYLEMCRDAEGWDPSFSYSPRVSATIQSALREASAEAGNVVVDLPEIFARHLGGALPDRRLFLDYCHLSAEGINVAAAAIASQVLKLLAGRSIAPGALQSRCPAPAAQVEGKASFLAAVHNAHFYQGYDIVHYWCARAVECWPEGAQLMTRFIDCQARRAPLLACRSVIELTELDALGAREYLLRGAKQRLDLTLGEAVAAAVRSIGLHIGEDLAALRLREHSIRTGPKELTDPYYSFAIPSFAKRAWTSCSLPNNGGSRSMFASAYWETSKFVFFGEKGRPAGLKLTYRLPPSCVSAGLIEVSVNGHAVAQACADRTWRTLEAAVAPEHLLDGINEILICWPGEPSCSEDVLAQTADALVTGPLPRFHRVFGEIHSLRAFEPRAPRFVAASRA
jgi:hypothetical protein